MFELTDALRRELQSMDTPTVCNALEIVAPRRRGYGYTTEPLFCARPNLGPMVGLARTATIRSAHPGDLAGEDARQLSDAYYAYIDQGPKPCVIVISDIDQARGYGSFWGEVNSAIHKGLGCLGVITDGGVRDLPDIAEGFQMLAGRVIPSHAFVHVVDFARPVTVAGMRVRDGDLIHADQHGAVVIPHDAAAGVRAAADLVIAREKVIIEAARKPGFDIEALRAAQGRSAEEPLMRVLWPQHYWQGDREPELIGLGPGIDARFAARFADVNDEDWRTCEGLVGPSPPLAVLEKLEKCRIYVKPAVGFDDVDLQAWGALGIPVCNTPDYGTREVADHAMALMLTLAKSIAFHDESLRADPRANWRPALNPFGQRLADRTFGIIGLGRIGTAVALRAKAFDMDVIFFDPYRPSGVELSIGVRRADSLEELLAQSDIVSVHAPLSDETRNLIGPAALGAVRKGVIILNTARGPIVDIDALHEAMKSGVVLAAGLDVLPEEPPDLERPLIAAWHAGEAWLKHRLIVTPHSAFFTPQSLRDIRLFSARTAGRYLRGGRLENCVNQEFLTTAR